MVVLLIWVMIIWFGLVYMKKAVDITKKREEEIMACSGDAKEESDDKIVYIAHSSKKFHNSGCHFILEEEIPIEIEEAKAKGYLSCKKCNPK